MGSRCGSVVGYKVRFDEKTSATTRILFVTDGIMLKEFANDPNMESVGAIMIDEAHERSLSTDILLGLLRDVIRRNKKIKIIVASATINADKFSNFFGNAPIFKIEGRTFPVETFYADTPIADYVAESAQTALDLHMEKPLPGDILIFLPGQDAIETCAEILKEKFSQQKDNMRTLHILPVYASLPPKEQARIYEKTPPGSRKIVIATNIAETSITIDGIRFVIDCGLCKQDFYNPAAMVEELRVVPTSQASAIQRAGRAGRTQSGRMLPSVHPVHLQE
ncbi:Helicase conserved C-terminal domain containing protein, putative [Angomonas deanei]|uniref:RNA helicase n=1 Tax=Angomonas deanei TaxID=59799 RepID=A0A7G2C5X5_9TRYP|nr:Helicase conserved C-terminal domain containing protein, putative [Angomonas deanei]